MLCRRVVQASTAGVRGEIELWKSATLLARLVSVRRQSRSDYGYQEVRPACSKSASASLSHLGLGASRVLGEREAFLARSKAWRDKLRTNNRGLFRGWLCFEVRGVLSVYDGGGGARQASDVFEILACAGPAPPTSAPPACQATPRLLLGHRGIGATSRHHVLYSSLWRSLKCNCSQSPNEARGGN